MMNHGFEQVARQRIEERLREADQARLARSVPAAPKRGRSWPARLTLSLARGLAHVAEAFDRHGPHQDDTLAEMEP